MFIKLNVNGHTGFGTKNVLKNNIDIALIHALDLTEELTLRAIEMKDQLVDNSVGAIYNALVLAYIVSCLEERFEYDDVICKLELTDEIKRYVVKRVAKLATGDLNEQYIKSFADFVQMYE